MKTILALLLASASLVACAQDAAPGRATGTAPAVAPGSAAEHARDAMRSLDPKIVIESIVPAPVAGFQQAVVGGQVLYVSNDGKYVMQGVLFDVRNRRDVGEDALKKLRADLLRSVPVSQRIVFAPAKPKYTVSVFTDVECGFCRKLHSQIADYNKQGIAVQYLAFPRMGLSSPDYRKMEAVWCSADRRKALTDAKNDRDVPYRDCKNPVAAEYKLGQRIGLTGTPMVLAADGTYLGGYLSPEDLRAALDKLAAGGEPTASGAVGIQ